MHILFFVCLISITAAFSPSGSHLNDPDTVWGDGCIWEKLTCDHGRFNMSQCWEWWHGHHDATPEHPYGWYALMTCDCEDGWRGPACDQPIDHRVCDEDQIFTGSFLDANETLKFECYLPLTPDTNYFYLNDHRIDVYVDLPKGTFDWTLFARLNMGGRAPEHYRSYRDMLEVMSCNCSECVGNLTPDDPKYTILYECSKVTCVGCSVEDGCSAIIGKIIPNASPPMKFGVREVQSDKNSANADVMASIKGQTDAFELSFECDSGMCLDNAIVQPVLHYPTYQWILISIVAVALFFCIAISILAVKSTLEYRNTRKFSRSFTPTPVPHQLSSFFVQNNKDDENPLISIPPPKHSAELNFSNVSYSVARSRGVIDFIKRRTPVEKTIISSISGSINSGELLALIGPSGAGKTTLLDILAGRQKGGNVGGYVNLKFDGVNVPRLSDVVSYMPQDDCFLETQSVFDIVLFSARLRLPIELTDCERHQRAEQVIEELNLESIASSRVSAVSTGERKRLAIAVELVADPAVLLLDEPTSGLDSHSSASLMTVLSKTAKLRGLLCICSIHQPPASIWRCFDQVLLLTKHGRTGYYGPGGRHAVDVVGSITDTVCPDLMNPAEFLLDAASGSTLQVSQLADAFSSYYYRNNPALEDALVSTSSSKFKKSRTASSYQQMLLLSGRAFSHISRDFTLLLMTLVLSVVSALLLGIIFYKVDFTEQGMQDRCGFLFFLIFFFSLMNLASLSSYVSDCNVFAREFGDGYYTTLPYMACKFLTDVLPLRLLPPLIFALITYFMVGLRPTYEHFAVFLVVVVFVNLVSSSAAHALSALTSGFSRDRDRGGTATVSSITSKVQLIAVIYFVFCMLFGGLLVSFGQNKNPKPTPGIPSPHESEYSPLINAVRSLRFVSFFHYAFDALMVNEFKGLMIKFHAPGFPPVVINGDVFIQTLSIEEDGFSYNASVLASMFVFFQLLLFCCLKFFHRSKTTNDAVKLTQSTTQPTDTYLNTPLIY